MSRPADTEAVAGLAQLEEWRASGALEEAMHKVVADMFDGVYGSLEDRAEFALGFIAAVDVVACGRLSIADDAGAYDLKDAIMRAFEDTHGRVSDDRLTDVFSRACAALHERAGK